MNERNDLEMAAAHFGNSLVVAEDVAPDSAAKVSLGSRIRKESILDRLPCDGFCANGEAATQMMRQVGNDLAATKHAISANIDLSLICSCKGCADKRLLAAEALEHHAGFLRTHGTPEALGHSFRRGGVLRKLGYKFV